MNRITTPCAIALALLSSAVPVRAAAVPAWATPAASNPGATGAKPSCRPEYPAAALRAAAQGTTRVRLTIDATGRITATDVVESAGPTPAHKLLDQAAAGALVGCPIKPARDATGNAVPAQFTVDYRWALDSSALVVPPDAATLPSTDGSTNGQPLPAGWKPARIRTVQPACLPTYPTEIFRAKVRGTTRLSFGVDEKGQMTDARFVGSAGSSTMQQALDSEAMRALSACRFDAGTDAQGQPQATRLVVEYRWTPN